MAAQLSDCSDLVVSQALEMGRVLQEEEAQSKTEEKEILDLGSDPNDPGSEKKTVRSEIDTSAPFESVKEAVSRFGGIGFWKPQSHKPHSQDSEHDIDITNIAKVEAQAEQLEKDLIVKERETFNVLKELESTKMIVEELKAKIQKEASEVNAVVNSYPDDKNVNHAEKENEENLLDGHQHSVGVLDLCPPSTPGFILTELKQAKLNLTRTTNDLADIRATVGSYNKKIEKERNSLEKTRQRLTSSSSKISSLEEEVNQTKQKLQLVKGGCDNNTMDISRELHRLGSETEQFKQISEIARLEVLRAMSEIEQTKTRINTAEMRLIAAKRLKEAARATEAIALADMEALSKSETPNPEGLTISFEEYSSLTSKAREAEELCNKKETDAMILVDEANLSKMDVLKRVEEVTKEVKNSKKVLEEALNRVEAANKGKLAVEEALRKWRSEHGQKRRSIQNSTKFKTARRDSSRMLDVNGVNMTDDDSKPVLRPTLSIGQILSRKLLLTEEFENAVQMGQGTGKRNISLGQMLNRTNDDDKSESEKKGHKQQLPAKRKKFGFARIPLLVTKQSKKKKRSTTSSRVPGCRSVDIEFV